MTAMLTTEGVPPVPATTLDDVLARRAAGARGVLLEDSSETSLGLADHRKKWATRLSAVLAAGFVATMVFSDAGREGEHARMQTADRCSQQQSTSSGDDPMESAVFRRYVALAYAVPLATLMGCSDEPGPPLPLAPVLAKESLDGGHVRPAALTYRSSIVFDGTFTHVRETSQLVITASTWKGTPAWRVAASGQFPADTLVLDRTTLVPLGAHSRRPAGTAGFSYAVDLQSRAVEFQARNRGGVTKDWRYDLPDSEPTPSPMLLPVAVGALPLEHGWSASFEVFHPWRFFIGPYLRRNGAWSGRIMASLHVVGDERVTVPAGTFDCWRIRVTRQSSGLSASDLEPEDIWVSKRDGWIVRTRSTRGAGDDTEDYETVLVGIQ